MDLFELQGLLALAGVPLVAARFAWATLDSKFPGLSTAGKFLNGVFREIEAATDVRGPQEPLFAPSPTGRGGDAGFAQPLREADKLRF